MEATHEKLDTYELETLLATVREESKKRKSWGYVIAISILASFGLALIGAAIWKLLGWDMGTAFVPGMIGGMFVGMAAISQKQVDATKSLAHYDDVRCVPAFADVLGCKDAKLELIAEQKLIQLLPLMKASDASLLSETQRKNLNAAIEKRGSTLACAILKAYEQIGDSSAIPFVERVLQNTKEILRRQAAEQCLPFLVQRAETENCAKLCCELQMATLKPLNQRCFCVLFHQQQKPNPKHFCALSHPRRKFMLQQQEQQAEQTTEYTTEWKPKIQSSLETPRQSEIFDTETGKVTTFDELLASLKAETANTKRRKRIVNAAIGTIGGLAIGSALLSGILRGDWNFMPYFGFIGIFSMGASSVLSDKGKKAADQLSCFDDVRMTGLFVEVLEDTDKKIAALAEAKLCELLPRLQASDANLFTAEQRAILNRRLLLSEKEFVIATLQAYEQIGDSAAIPFVERLLRGEGKVDFAPDVMVAATACLPFLVQRAKQQEQSQTLLRAAENSTAPETLLRPANATLETQPETLLRPTQQ